MKKESIKVLGIIVLFVLLLIIYLSIIIIGNENKPYNTESAEYFHPKILLDHDDNVCLFWLSNAGHYDNTYSESKADLYFSKIDKDMHPIITNKRIYSNLLDSSCYYVKIDSNNDFHISIKNRYNNTYLKLDKNGDLIANSSLFEAQILPDLPLIQVNDNELLYLKNNGVISSDNTLSIVYVNKDRYNWSDYNEKSRDINLIKFSRNGSKLIDNKTLFSIPIDTYPSGSEYLFMYSIEKLNNNTAWTLLTRHFSSESYDIIEANYNLDSNIGKYNIIFTRRSGSESFKYLILFDGDKYNNKHIFIINEGTHMEPTGNTIILYKCSSFSGDYNFTWDQRNKTMIDFKVDYEQNINLLYKTGGELHYQKLRILKDKPVPIVLHDGQTTLSDDYNIQLTPSDDETSYQTMCGTIIFPILLVPFAVFIRKKINK